MIRCEPNRTTRESRYLSPALIGDWGDACSANQRPEVAVARVTQYHNIPQSSRKLLNTMALVFEKKSFCDFFSSIIARDECDPGDNCFEDCYNAIAGPTITHLLNYKTSIPKPFYFSREQQNSKGIYIINSNAYISIHQLIYFCHKLLNKPTMAS